MRKLILGTAGHIDHGKTALVRALTGVDTDRLPEEKRRGITIDLGFANLVLPSGDEIGIVDVPGHEAFVKNMLAGATGVDVALLVIAADESVMPQTREHLAILELLGIRSGVVALTKADLVDEDWIELVRGEVRDTIADGALANAPIIPVSARTGAGLADLIDRIADAANAVAARDADDLFRLPVDRVFTVRGTGTVVTGTVWSGAVQHDQPVRLLPVDRPVRLRGIQAFGHDRDRVSAGERAALALAGIARSDIARGDTLAVGDGWVASSMLTARVQVLPEAALPLRNRQRVRFHLGTAEVLGRLALLENAQIVPGEEAWVQLRLEAPVVARAGDRFVIRSYSPVTTIAGGRVAEPTPGKRKSLSRDDRSRLDDLLSGIVRDSVVAVVASRGGEGVTASRLPVVTPHSPSAVAGAVAGHDRLLNLDGTVFHADAADGCRAALLRAVERYHVANPLAPGPTLDDLRRVLPPGTAPALFAATLRSLAAEAVLMVQGSTVQRAGFAPRLTPDQQAAVGRIVAAFEAGMLAPPAVTELGAELAARPDLDRLLHYLDRQGTLVQLAPNQWIARRAVEEAAARARTSLPGRPLTPTDFKDLFGISRKYLIPLLEYFDRVGITVRRGEVRELTTTAGRA